MVYFVECILFNTLLYFDIYRGRDIVQEISTDITKQLLILHKTGEDK